MSKKMLAFLTGCYLNTSWVITTWLEGTVWSALGLVEGPEWARWLVIAIYLLTLFLNPLSLWMATDIVSDEF